MRRREEEQAREWKGGRKVRRKGRRQWEREVGSGEERERKGSPHTSFPGEWLNPGQTTEFPL